MDTIISYRNKLDGELSKYPTFVKLEQQTGISKVNIVFCAAGLAFLVLQFKNFALMLVNLAALGIPLFFSLHNVSEQSRLLNSMLYFAFFSILLMIERSFPFVQKTIPLYPFIKGAFTFWLFAPKYNGASFIFNNVTRSLCPQLCSSMACSMKKSVSSTKQASSQIAGKLSETIQMAVSTPLKDD